MTITLGLPELILGGLFLITLARGIYILFIKNPNAGSIGDMFGYGLVLMIETVVLAALLVIYIVIYGGIRWW